MDRRAGRGRRTTMRRGDIYLVSLNLASGHEQHGSQLVLVLSPTKFNEATQLPVVLPITRSGESVHRMGFAVPVTGIRTTGIVRCDQPRVIDLAARHARLPHGRSSGESRNAF